MHVTHVTLIPVIWDF